MTNMIILITPEITELNTHDTQSNPGAILSAKKPPKPLASKACQTPSTGANFNAIFSSKPLEIKLGSTAKRPIAKTTPMTPAKIDIIVVSPEDFFFSFFAGAAFGVEACSVFDSASGSSAMLSGVMISSFGKTSNTSTGSPSSAISSSLAGTSITSSGSLSTCGASGTVATSGSSSTVTAPPFFLAFFAAFLAAFSFANSSSISSRPDISAERISDL